MSGVVQTLLNHCLMNAARLAERLVSAFFVEAVFNFFAFATC